MGVQITLALLIALALGADVPGTVQSAQSSDHSSRPLQPQSRLLLVRFVDGEFARVVQPLPGGKKGYKVPAGKPLDMKKLSDALRLYGTAAGQGDTVQITSIEFRANQIVLSINGGGKKHYHWRDHLQVSMGGAS